MKKVRQREGSISCNSYMQNPKRNDTNEHIYKTETVSQTERMNLWLQWGRMGEAIAREFGLDVYTLLGNKGLRPSQGTLLNGKSQPGWEGSLGESGYMYMYG